MREKVALETRIEWMMKWAAQVRDEIKADSMTVKITKRKVEIIFYWGNPDAEYPNAWWLSANTVDKMRIALVSARVAASVRGNIENGIKPCVASWAG